tara:strand:- start:156 stop:314 length:159 start_codon:yes stop_codon:yes gene_type:complete
MYLYLFSGFFPLVRGNVNDYPINTHSLSSLLLLSLPVPLFLSLLTFNSKTQR